MRCRYGGSPHSALSDVAASCYTTARPGRPSSAVAPSVSWLSAWWAFLAAACGRTVMPTACWFRLGRRSRQTSCQAAYPLLLTARESCHSTSPPLRYRYFNLLLPEPLRGVSAVSCSALAAGVLTYRAGSSYSRQLAPCTLKRMTLLAYCWPLFMPPRLCWLLPLNNCYCPARCCCS